MTNKDELLEKKDIIFNRNQRRYFEYHLLRAELKGRKEAKEEMKKEFERIIDELTETIDSKIYKNAYRTIIDVEDLKQKIKEMNL